MARENKAKYVILGLLAHEDLNGYEIKKRLEIGIENFFNLSYGQIYPHLANMERRGLVTKKIDTNQNNLVRKKYTIADKGREELQKWVASEVEEEKIQYEILLKIFFGSQVPIEENIRNINIFRERSLQKLKLMQKFESNLRLVVGESIDHIYYLQTVIFGIGIYEAHIAWADIAIKNLASLKKQ